MLSPPKSLDQIKPNLVCKLLTCMKRSTAKDFLTFPPGALGRGQKVKFHVFSILFNHWTKFIQIWCMRYSHDCGVKRQLSLVLPPGALGRGQKVKYHLISITKSISKIFTPNIVCVLTNERYKIYQTGFYSVA